MRSPFNTEIESVFIGDSGSGGAEGLVPAPAAGDAAAGKFLSADGSFQVPPGIGGGSVTSVSVVTANGYEGSVSNPATTPAITIKTHWTEITGTTQALVAGNRYVANNASLVTFSLPSTAAFGDEFEIVTKSLSGWKLTQNAGQQIQFGDGSTTAGVGGYIQNTTAGDVVRLLCITADTTFIVLSSMGNLTGS